MRSAKTFTDDEAEYFYDTVGHAPLAIDRLLDVRTTKGRKQSLAQSATHQGMFVTACSVDEYAEEKRTEKNLIVRSGISEAETTNNKRLRSTFCIEAIQTRSIARPLCDIRASCHNNSSDLTHLNSGFLGRLRTTYCRQDNKRVAKRLWASRPKDCT